MTLAARRRTRRPSHRACLALLPALAALAFLADAATAPSADARITRYPAGHYIRHVRLQGATPGTLRTGLWVMERSTGKVRLCVVQGGPGGAASGAETVTCSPWAGGADTPGRYQMTDIRAQVPTATGRRIWAIIGVWVLNYTTGQVRACLFQDLARPAASLRCSPFK